MITRTNLWFVWLGLLGLLSITSTSSAFMSHRGVGDTRIRSTWLGLHDSRKDHGTSNNKRMIVERQLSVSNKDVTSCWWPQQANMAPWCGSWVLVIVAMASSFGLAPIAAFADEYGVETEAPTLFTGESVMVREGIDIRYGSPIVFFGPLSSWYTIATIIIKPSHVCPCIRYGAYGCVDLYQTWDIGSMS